MYDCHGFQRRYGNDVVACRSLRDGQILGNGSIVGEYPSSLDPLDGCENAEVPQGHVEQPWCLHCG